MSDKPPPKSIKMAKKEPIFEEFLLAKEIQEFRKSIIPNIEQTQLVSRKSKFSIAIPRKSITQREKHSLRMMSRDFRMSTFDDFRFRYQQFSHVPKKRFHYNPQVTYVADIERPTSFHRKCAFTSETIWYYHMQMIIVLIIVWLNVHPPKPPSDPLLIIVLVFYIVLIIDFVMSFIMQHVVDITIKVPNPVAKPLWIFIIIFIALLPIELIYQPEYWPVQVIISCRFALFTIRLLYDFVRRSLFLKMSMIERIFELIALLACIRTSIALFVFRINRLEYSTNVFDVSWMEFELELVNHNLKVYQHDVPIIISVYLLNFFIYIPYICLLMLTHILTNTPKYSYITLVNNFRAILVSRYGISQDNSKRVLDYLQLTWATRADFMFMHAALAERVCCASMYQAMCQDRNLYALQHCPMFNNFDFYILRYLAQLVKPRIYLKDVYLYKFPLRKLSMFYIASGEVHILSNEDGNTPIIKFTAGTCVGSIALVRPYRSNSNFRIGSNCEIYELTTKKFANFARYYPNEYRQCLKYIQNKIDIAFILKNLKQQVEPKAIDKTIIWIKRELHRLLSFTAINPSDHKISNIYLMELFKNSQLNDVIYTKMNLQSLSIKPRDSQFHDLVFIKSSCPWVFRPDSPLLKVLWKIVFVISIFSCCIILYETLIRQTLIFSLIHWFGIFGMALEVILLCMTPIGLHTSRKTWVIFIDRCSNMTFLLDIISIIVSIAVEVQSTPNIVYVWLSTLRLWRLFAIYKVIESKVVSNLFLKQIITIAALLTIVWFFIATIYTSMSEYGESFFSYFYLERAMSLTISFKGLMFSILPLHVRHIVMGAILASSYHLFRNDSIQITNTLNSTHRFMNSGLVSKTNISLTWRLHSFVTLLINDYHYLSLKNQKQQFVRFPKYIEQLVKPENLLVLMNQSEFFAKFPKDLIKELSRCSTVETFASNALILTRGVRCKDFYILVKGEVCSVELNSVRKVEQSTDLNCLEVILGLPTARHMVAFSNVIIVSISYAKFLELVKQFPTTNNIFLKSIESIREELKKELLKIIYGKPFSIIEVSRIPEITSFYIYKCVMYSDSIEAYNYFPPFDSLGIFAFVRFFLLRCTFHPEGTFYRRWEKSRLMFLCVNIVVYLVPAYIQRNIELYLLFFNCLGFIDIYLRFHVCYYNNDGILVKHPLLTAKHYFSRSFVIDLFCVIPLEFYSEHTMSRSLIRAFRMVQLYRLLGYRRYSFTKNYLITIIGLLYVMLIISACVSTFIFELHCKGTTVNEVHCTDLLKGGTGNKIDDLRESMNDIAVERFFSVLLFVGVFWRAICLGITFNAYVSTHVFLNKASTNFLKLNNFMKAQKIPFKMRSQVASYFDAQWRWIDQNNINDVLVLMNVSLKRDLLFHVYGDPFLRFNHFTDDYRNIVDFYKNVFLECTSKICPTYGRFITMNDIDSMIYFVYRGMVDVIGAENQLQVTLMPGAIFGNLQEAEETKQMITAVAKCNTQCLCLRSEQLFEILQFFPKIQANYFKITRKTRFFIKSKAKAFTRMQMLTAHQQFMLYAINRILFVHLVVVCYLGNLLNIYQIATGERHFSFLILLYSIDIFHIVAMILKYFKPIKSDLGYWCTSVKDIYFFAGSRHEICFDLITSIPLDVLVFFDVLNFSETTYIFSALRINRIFRVYYNIAEYRKLTSKYISNYNELMRKIIAICYQIIWYSFVITMIMILLDMFVKSDTIGSLLQRRVDASLANVKDLRTMRALHKLQIFIFYFRIVALDSVSQIPEYSSHHNVIRESLFTFNAYVHFAMQIINVCHFYPVIYDIYSRNAFIGTMLFNDMLKHSTCYTNYMKSRFIQNSRYVYSCESKESMLALQSESTPNYLKEMVLNACFSNYLTHHPIFKYCHPDFLRQMARGLKLVHIPKGYEVLHKFDTRRCMFFIVKGSVVMLANDDDIIQNYLHKLRPGECFNFRAGLNQEKLAKFTFTCNSNAVILELEYDSWSKLIPFFQATDKILLKVGNKFRHEPFLKIDLPKRFVYASNFKATRKYIVDPLKKIKKQIFH